MIDDLSLEAYTHATELEPQKLNEALLDIAVALNSTLNLAELLERILTNLGRVVPHDTANIMLIEEGLAHIVGGQGYEALGLPSMVGRSFVVDRYQTLRHMSETGQPMVISDTDHSAGWVNRPDTAWIHSYAGAPIFSRGQLVGFLNLASARPEFYNEAFLVPLRAFVEQAGLAIGNARLFEQAQQEIAERQQAETRLQAYQEHLERLVQERTAKLEQAMAETAASYDRIDAILHSVGDGLIMTDLDQRVVLVNPAAESLLGFAPGDMLGREIGEVIADERLRTVIERTLAEVNSSEVDLDMGAAGSRRVVQARTSLVQDEQQQPLGVVAILQDVTKLRDLDDLKTQILTTAAHQLRTPLTSILGYSELMLNRPMGPERQQGFLQRIYDQSVHLKKVIDDLLDVSRLQLGREMTLERQPVQVSELVDEVASFFDQQAEGHTLTVVGLNRLPPVPGDAFRLRQVIWVLLSNAIRYSPAGGEVMITGRETETALELSIRDEGVGMTAAEQAHLFEPFFRADASQRSFEGGTGLGLVISKLIIEQHGGEIWLTSQPDMGTTVYFTLPLGA